MHIKFYIYSGDNRVANKANGLDYLTEQYGTLRYPASIINPTIRIDVTKLRETQGLWENFIKKCNYFYILDFARRYYITSKILDNDNIVTITGHVDVLYTYYDDYTELSAYVHRSGNNYDRYIEDQNVVYQNKPEILEYVPANDIPNLDYVELSWADEDETDRNEPTKLLARNVRYTVTYYQNRDGVNVGGVAVPFDNKLGLGDISSTNIDSFTFGKSIIATSHTYIQDVLTNALNNSDRFGSWIGSVVAFPFRLARGFNYTDDSELSAYTTIDVGLSDSSHGGTFNISNVFPTQNNAVGLTFGAYLLLKTFKILPPSTFMDYEPYTKYELYLPFVGYVPLPSKLVVGKRIWVYMTVNYENGDGTMYVYTSSDDDLSFNPQNAKLIFSQDCQIGIVVSVGKSNQEEVERNKKSIGISTAVSALGSALSLGAGLASGNMIMTAGGAMGLVKAFGGATANLVNLVERGALSISNAHSALSTPLRITIRRTRLLPTVDDYDYVRDFKTNFGLPVEKIVKLSNCIGFTTVDESIILDDLVAMDEEKEELRGLLSSGVIL